MELGEIDFHDYARDAIDAGIGLAALDLGFKRKSARRYVLEDGDLTFWIGFQAPAMTEFSDYAGVVSRELNEMIAAAGIDLGFYNLDAPAKAHVWNSAIIDWSYRSRASERAAHDAARKWGPIGWFLPWRERWARRDPLTQCRFTEHDRWATAGDVAGCAAFSAERWRQVVAPWLDRMRDPLRFAQRYRLGRWSIVRDHVSAIAFARAGAMEEAKWLLEQEYLRRNWTFEKALAAELSSPNGDAKKLTREELETRAAEGAALAQEHARRVERVAASINVDLLSD